MGPLAQGVDPGIGPAGPGHPDALPGGLKQGLFQGLLDADLVFLKLPADVIRAQIGYVQQYAHGVLLSGVQGLSAAKATQSFLRRTSRTR